MRSSLYFPCAILILVQKIPIILIGVAVFVYPISIFCIIWSQYENVHNFP